jgi:hypothetical protein
VATGPNPISSSQFLPDVLPRDFPKRQMTYDAEVIWVVPPNDFEITRWATLLLGKRKAAGEKEKCGFTLGLTPRWPTLNCKSANIRLYVIAHGVDISGAVPPEIKLSTVREGEATDMNSLTAADFSQKLRDLVLQAPAKRVKRIALLMCDAGGVKAPDAKGSILPSDSFAQRLVNKCEDLTDDITARMGFVSGNPTLIEKAQIDKAYKDAFAAGKTRSDKNPLQTDMAGTKEASLTNLAKQVDGREDFRTYIFTANKPPKLKTGYSE